MKPLQYATTSELNSLIERLVDRLIIETPLVVFDTETTGLSAFQDRMTQVAAMILWPSGYRESFSWELNPGVPIPKKITELTGHTDESVAGKPSFAEVADQILEVLSCGVLVAHNGVFDLRFVSAAARDADKQMPFGILVDTMLMARELHDFSNNKLSTVVRELGIPMRDAHRADEDVAMTADVLQRMIYDHQAQDVADLIKMTGQLLTSLPVIDTEVKLTIRQAIDECLPVRISYTKYRSKEVMHRTISPYDMVGGYINAFCHMRQEERRFRIDRVGKAELVRDEQYVGIGYGS